MNNKHYSSPMSILISSVHCKSQPRKSPSRMSGLKYVSEMAKTHLCMYLCTFLISIVGVLIVPLSILFSLQEKEMPPLEPIPLSEEDSPKLQRKVEALEETLSATVASNEQRVANLGLELDAEKERVLQIEKDKRYIVLCGVSVCVHACICARIWYNM